MEPLTFSVVFNGKTICICLWAVSVRRLLFEFEVNSVVDHVTRSSSDWRSILLNLSLSTNQCIIVKVVPNLLIQTDARLPCDSRFCAASNQRNSYLLMAFWQFCCKISHAIYLSYNEILCVVKHAKVSRSKMNLELHLNSIRREI